MRSRPAFVDVGEAALWISAELQKEGLAIPDEVVLRILNRETRFLVMVGLARAGDENNPKAGHILREAYWVVDPRAQVEADQKIESQEEEV